MSPAVARPRLLREVVEGGSWCYVRCSCNIFSNPLLHTLSPPFTLPSIYLTGYPHPRHGAQKGSPLNRNIPARRDQARFSIRISQIGRGLSRHILRPGAAHPLLSYIPSTKRYSIQSRWFLYHTHSLPSPFSCERSGDEGGSLASPSLRQHPGGGTVVCLRKVLRCLPSARTLIVIYNPRLLGARCRARTSPRR